jgi:dTDP-4-amino-4,6-dideoxygalactose transaminase
MSAILLDIQPGDEVIIPDFTFVSTVNAFVLRGARPVFLDVRPDTLNLDESKLEAALTSRTKAIVPVHYAGVGCDMDSIMDIANSHYVAVIEDNAHGLFGKYKGRYLGTFGSMAAQSFHETKNFYCGEGGALLINDPVLAERAEIVREKGTNRSRFFRGQVDKYTWVDIGSSYLPSDILAAFLYAQFEQRDKIQNHRKNVWDMYNTALKSWAEEQGVQLPFIPSDCEQAYHMFYMLLPNLELRQKLILYLREQGIYSVFHYLPLHLSDMGQGFGYKSGEFPMTEQISDQLIRLPFHNALTSNDQEHAICLVILTTILTYGTMISQLGFYRDDWYLLWTNESQGASGLLNLFRGDRPFLGWLYIFDFSMLGTSPFGWHLYALIIKIISALAFFWLVRSIWPKRKIETTFITLLFIVYPGFYQQPNALTFKQLLLAYAAALFSLSLTVQVLKANKTINKVLLTILAVVLAAFYIFIYEPLIGLEIARLFLI